MKEKQKELKYYFSPPTQGFYHEKLTRNCIEVTKEKHDELRSLQGKGKIIVLDKKGNLTAVDPPKEKEAMAFQIPAAFALTKSDLVVIRCFENGIEVPKAWKEYRNKLREIASGGGDKLPDAPKYPKGT